MLCVRIERMVILNCELGSTQTVTSCIGSHSCKLPNDTLSCWWEHVIVFCVVMS